MSITVDTREQDPYRFKRLRPPVTPFRLIGQGLKTGDYGLWMPDVPVAEQITLERKSLQDLYGTATAGRGRFERELARMEAYGYAAIIIEAPLSAIACPDKHLRHPTQADPRSVLMSLLAWSQRFGVHVWPCWSRQLAEQWTYRLLERWWLDGRSEK